MGGILFEIDLLTAHEPGIPWGETPPFTAGGTLTATKRIASSSCVAICHSRLMERSGAGCGGMGWVAFMPIPTNGVAI